MPLSEENKALVEGAVPPRAMQSINSGVVFYPENLERLLSAARAEERAKTQAFPNREAIEALPDDRLHSLFSLINSVYLLRFRANVGAPKEDSMAKRIASLAIGEDTFLQMEGKWLHNWTRKRARELLRNANAQWKSARTTKGLKVTRIS